MDNLLSFFGVKNKSVDARGIGFHLIGNKRHTIYKDKKGRYYIVGGKKRYLKKGTRLSSPIKRKGPKKQKDYSKVKRHSPKRKVVKNKKEQVIGKRLSARHVYDTEGRKALGKKFRILQKDGTYKLKVLRLRKNGSPYFANKFGNKVSFPLDLQLHGPAFDNLTGYKNTWPNYPFMIPPGGVRQPDKMRLFPKGVHFHENSFGKKIMCFG